MSARCLLVFILLGALSACGKSSDSTAASPLSIEGDWYSDCLDIGDGYFLKVKMLNTGSESELITDYSSGSSCINVLMTDRSERTFEIKGQDDAGAAKVDITYGGTFRTIQSTADVDDHNAKNSFGFSDWEKGKEKEITGGKYDENSAPEHAKGDIAYLLYKITEDALIPGDTSTGDGSSEDKRPTKLSTSVELKKQ